MAPSQQKQPGRAIQSPPYAFKWAEHPISNGTRAGQLSKSSLPRLAAGRAGICILWLVCIRDLDLGTSASQKLPLTTTCKAWLGSRLGLRARTVFNLSHHLQVTARPSAHPTVNQDAKWPRKFCQGHSSRHSRSKSQHSMSGPGIAHVLCFRIRKKHPAVR